MRLFFFGMGYSSRATARALHLLADPQIPVAGTTRSAEAAESEADSAYRIHVFDGEVPGTTLSEDLRAATHVILSIPPDERGDPALNLLQIAIGFLSQAPFNEIERIDAGVESFPGRGRECMNQRDHAS